MAVATAPAPQRKLLTRTEVAQRLGIHERTVDDWRARGLIKATKLGGRLVRFHESEVERVESEGVEG
ncbi:MAG: helix-turn-helix domain-containing protein [Planctomycetota bacterium]